MPYFEPHPDLPERPYFCPNCRAYFVAQSGARNISCCVAHAPGDCCHFGETRLGAPHHPEASSPFLYDTTVPSVFGDTTTMPPGYFVRVTIGGGNC